MLIDRRGKDRPPGDRARANAAAEVRLPGGLERCGNRGLGTAAAGRIYFVGRNGVTYVIKPTGKFEVLAINKLDDAID